MNRVFSNGRYRIITPLIDLIIIYAAVAIAYSVLESSLASYVDNLYAFISISPYIGISYLIIAHIFELDKPKDFSFLGVAYTVTLAIFVLFCVSMAISFLTREFAYPRSVLIFSSILQIVLLSIWHLFINRLYYKENKKKKVLIVGYQKARELAYKLLESNGMWSGIEHISSPNNYKLFDYINECDITFLTEDIDESIKQSIVRYCVTNNRAVLYEPQNSEILLFNSEFLQADDAPLLGVRYLGITSGNEAIKRFIDVCVGILGAIVFVIPITIVYFVLKIDGGTAFFVQERITRGGRVFKIYKFRTMIENAEAKSGPVLASNDDARITRLGHFLRATRLDETPQIFNILKGDMSIVGPRPERPFFVAQFKKEYPDYDLRHRVKAGLTGLAQIQGKYNTSVRDKLKYDLLYINGYSVALDLKLIMQTLNILLRKSSTEGLKEESRINDQIERLYKEE